MSTAAVAAETLDICLRGGQQQGSGATSGDRNSAGRADRVQLRAAVLAKRRPWFP